MGGGTAWSRTAHCCVLAHVNPFYFMREQGENLPQLHYLKDVHPWERACFLWRQLFIAGSLFLFKALYSVQIHYLLVMLFIRVQLNYAPDTYLDIIIWNKFRNSRSFIIIITRTATWFLENSLPQTRPWPLAFPPGLFFLDLIPARWYGAMNQRSSGCAFW